MAEKTRSRTIAPQPTVSRPELLVGNSDHAFRQFVHDTLAFSARFLSSKGSLAKRDFYKTSSSAPSISPPSSP